MSIRLDSAELSVLVLPDDGGDIASVITRDTGVELLFQTPWGRRDRARLPARADSRVSWFDGYGGGWQVLFPNAGDESVGPGVRWPYHGEAGRLAWSVETRSATAAEFTVRLLSAPASLHRRVVLDGPRLLVTETVTNLSDQPLECMWVHHPAFAAPLIGPGARLRIAGCRVATDDELAGDLADNGRWIWPAAADRAGRPVDLSVLPAPGSGVARLAYLYEFERAEVTVVNPAAGLSAALRWSPELWPCVWLWEEVHATRGYPWFGLAHVVAVEPASTMPALGLDRSRRAGGRPLTIPAGTSRSGWLDLEIGTP